MIWDNKTQVDGSAYDATARDGKTWTAACQNAVRDKIEAMPSATSTTTFTNKRITSRVASTTDQASAAIDCNSYDVYQLTAIANDTTFTVTGTPTDWQKLLIRFKDGWVAKWLTFTWFTAMWVNIPTITVVSKRCYVGCIYSSTASTRHVVAVWQEA